MCNKQFKRRLVWVFFALAVPWFSGVHAASLHAIIVANVKDRGIGSFQDVPKMQDLTLSIRRATCLGGQDIVIEAEPGARGKIEQAFNGLAVGPEDVVLFYYSGHGASPGGEDRWPTMGVEGSSANLLKLSTVKETLQSKNPRLLIAMADACNVPMGGDSSRGRKQVEQAAGFKKLFMGYKGTIIASSSKPGQYSFGDPQTGGYFTKQFLEAANEGQASANPDWQAIMDTAIKAIPVQHDEQKNQQPQAKVDVIPIGGRRDDNNNWDCGAGGNPAPIGPDKNKQGEKPKLPSPPSSSDYPKCSDDEMKREGNKNCCLDKSGEKRCFND